MIRRESVRGLKHEEPAVFRAREHAVSHMASFDRDYEFRAQQRLDNLTKPIAFDIDDYETMLHKSI
jgi:hypothetical protein